MALLSFFTSASDAGTVADLGTTHDAVVGLGVTLVSGTDAISGKGSGHSVTVLGAVVGTTSAVRLGDGLTANQTVTVADTGYLNSSTSAVVIFGAAGRVENSGSIFGNNWGLYFQTSGFGYSIVDNYGSIRGGTAIGFNGLETYVLRNFGTIEATNGALFAASGARAQVTNYGHIAGDMYFGDMDDRMTSSGDIRGLIRMGGGDDSLVMRGSFAGSITLDSGSDTYVGTRLECQDLRISGGEGKDAMFLGAATEAVDGGVGKDLVSFAGARSGVMVFLDHSASNAGWAKGDSFVNVENVAGSDHSDHLQGDAGRNDLRGALGDDTLVGGGSGDTLTGDAGKDRLSGGEGSDVFVFWEGAPTEADVITDFSNARGNNDVIRIVAASFGGGLVAGPVSADILRIGLGHEAGDADDRFLFNTANNSLWFDPDGNGDAVAVMIANLQHGATFTIADLELI